MKRPIAAALACLALLGTAGETRAAEWTLDARVEPASPGDGEPFRYRIEVAGSERPEVASPRLTGLDGLTVLGGPSSSTSFQWRNGVSSSSVALTWVLAAEGPGEYEIPAQTLEVSGQQVTTDPVRFRVGATAPGSAPPASGRQEPAEVLLRASVSDDRVYVGQPLSLEVVLLSRETLRGVEWVELPSFADFLVEELEVDADREQHRTTFDGSVYSAYPLARKVLVPTHDGTFRIDPFAIRAAVVDRDRDPFRDFFRLGRSREVLRRSEEIAVTVLPLPEAGKPADFSGAVGRFEMEVALDRTEAAVDDAVALRVTVRGEGLLRGVAPPAVPSSPALKVFEPRVEDTRSLRDGRPRSSRTWEWVLVPLTAGDLRLPDLRFTYFDPDEESYREEVAPGPLLTVRRGDPSRPERYAAGGLRPQRREISFIKARRGPLAERAVRIDERGWFRVLVVVPLLLVPVGAAAGRRWFRLQQDRGRIRARRAAKRARRQLRSLHRLTEADGGDSFHEHAARILVDYVADRFDRSASGLTYDGLDELLAGRGVDRETRSAVRACLERCDFARYVPSSRDAAGRAEVLEEVTRLVDALEERL